MELLVTGGAGFMRGHLAEQFIDDGEAVNIGINALAEGIRDLLVPELELEYAERHDADHTHASTERAAELLGYEPTRTIREGVGEWYEPLVLAS